MTKEKYSAFVAEVSEIMGLGKPIDILKLCVITDRFINPYQKRITELETQIEKMKCCSNCNGINAIGLRTEKCKFCMRNKALSEWELKND